MGAFVTGVRKGGGICLDVGNVLCHGGSGGTFLQVGDMGYDSPYWEDYGRIVPLGGPQTDITESEEEDGWDVGLPPTGRGKGGGRHNGGGDIHRPPTEHSCTTYRNKAHYGTVYGGDADTR